MTKSPKLQDLLHELVDLLCRVPVAETFRGRTTLLPDPGQKLDRSEYETKHVDLLHIAKGLYESDGVEGLGRLIQKARAQVEAVALGQELATLAAQLPLTGQAIASEVQAFSRECVARYLEALRERWGWLYSLLGGEAKAIDASFVSLSLCGPYSRPEKMAFMELEDAVRRVHQRFLSRGLSADEGEEKKSITSDELEQEAPKAIVVGLPGAGKTTLLRYLACKAAVKRREHESAPFPLYLECRSISSVDWANANKESAQLWWDIGVKPLLDVGWSDAEKEALKAVFRGQIREGKVALYLDALDECSDASLRQTLVDDFVRQCKARGICVLSTRPHGLPPTGLKGFEELELAFLEKDASKRFIRIYTPEELVAPFEELLAERSELAELCRNPFLLKTAIALFEREGGTLPEGRIAYYEKLVQWLVKDRDVGMSEGEDKKRRFLLPHATKSRRKVLEAAAFAGLFGVGERRLLFREEDLEDRIEHLFTSKDDEWKEKLLHDVQLSAFLVPVGEGVWAFPHLTLQEFLAACFLGKLHKEEPEQAWNDIEKAYYRKELRESEVLPMFLGKAGQGEAGSLFERFAELPEEIAFGNLRLWIRALGYLPDLEAEEQNTPHLGELGASQLAFVPAAGGVALNFPPSPSQPSRVVGPLLRRLSYLLKCYGGLFLNGIVDDIRASGQAGKLLLRPFMDLLKDKDENVRYHAAKALGKIGGEKVVGALVEALGDENKDVRWGTVIALGKVGGEKVVGPLKRVLEDANEHKDVRRSAASALGSAGEKAVGPLVKALGDENHDVRRIAVRALSYVGSEKAVEPLAEALEAQEAPVRQSAVIVLGEIGNWKALEFLVKALGDEEAFVRRSAVEALGELGSEKELGLLVKALEDENEEVRLSAVEALGKLGGAGAVEPLVGALEDESEEVRLSAMRVLGRIGNEKAVEPLVEALGDGQASVRRSVVEALGKIGSEEAVEPLVKALEDEDGGVRRSAVEALSFARNDTVLESLLRTLGDNDEQVRRSTAVVLGYSESEKVVEPLVKALEDKDENVRQIAAEVLGYMGGERAVEALVEALEDQDIRWYVVRALGKIGGEKAVGPLVEAFQDEDASVRWSVVEALGKIGGEKVVGPLVGALEDQNDEVRKIAIQALGEFGGEEAVEPLVKALGDEEAFVRRSAVEALGELGSEKELGLLVKALEDENEEVRLSAVEALGKLGGAGAVEPLVGALEDESEEVRLSAMRVLGRIGNEKAVEPLVEALGDGQASVRRSVVEALGKIGSENVKGALVKALYDKDKHVRRSAARALESLSYFVACPEDEG